MKKKHFLALILPFMFAILPASVSAAETQQTPKEYYIYMGIGFLLLLLAAGALAFVYVRLRKQENRLLDGRRGRKDALRAWQNVSNKEMFHTVLLLIGCGLLARLILAGPSMGFGNDIALFKHWASTSADGLLDTYNVLGDNIDYPPGYVYILNLCGHLGNLFHAQDTMLYTIIIKLPAILSDCGIGFFLYLFCKERTSAKWTYFFVLLWMFNPLSILDSAVWGQVDSVLALALVAALYFITKEKYVLSAVLFGVGVMLKPQAIIVLPILFFALLKNKYKRVRTFLFSALAGIGTAVGLALPFGLSVDMTTSHMHTTVTPILQLLHADGGGVITKIATPFAWILSLFMGTTGHYDYATVNALNFFFAMDANWVKDSESFWGLTYFIWGMIFIVLGTALTWFLYLKSKRTKTVPFLCAAALLLFVANFGPRMHERYFYPAVVFLLIAAVLANHKAIFGFFVLSSLLGYLSVLEILVDLNLGAPWMWPTLSPLRLLLSWGNVLVAIGVMVVAFMYAFGKIEDGQVNKKIWSVEK